MMEDRVKIFLCEDDENLGMLLREYLQAKGFEVDLFLDGESGDEAFKLTKYDLCLLDVMMPKKDGFTLGRDIRMYNADVPIVYLTAKTLREDVVEGFKSGADDYMTKPFSMEELLLRIEAIMRRVNGRKKVLTDCPYQLGIFAFDWVKQTLSHNEQSYRLTTKENALLMLLCENINEQLDREASLKSIWGENNYFNARSMDVYVTKLRKLLKDDERIEILNIHSKGYKLIAPVMNSEAEA
ncbi:DNA-binding response regulator [Bacteroidia bacterium]|nr:DNA-binding response regulator [Bacteroidia bacterium]